MLRMFASGCAAGGSGQGDCTDEVAPVGGL